MAETVAVSTNDGLVISAVKLNVPPGSGRVRYSAALVTTKSTAGTSVSVTVTSFDWAEESFPSSSTAVALTWLVQEDPGAQVWLTVKVQVIDSPGESMFGKA